MALFPLTTAKSRLLAAAVFAGCGFIVTFTPYPRPAVIAWLIMALFIVGAIAGVKLLEALPFPPRGKRYVAFTIFVAAFLSMTAEITMMRNSETMLNFLIPLLIMLCWSAVFYLMWAFVQAQSEPVVEAAPVPQAPEPEVQPKPQPKPATQLSDPDLIERL
ncbi:MAG: hypothetical protein H6978_00615 [Gammaproteobacteria bacterium]|nr:hypothetical protein [Gammaproteobacteria bacterium]